MTPAPNTPVAVRSLLAAAVVLAATAAPAAVCQVPSASHPTIQSAVDDPTCTELVLAAQTFTESPVIPRNLTVRGASSTATVVAGQLEVTGGPVALEDLKVDTSGPVQRGRFNDALWVHSGGRVTGTNLLVVHSPLLFGDGFESGNTSAWSNTLP
jgi:hypothetical protein